MKLQHVRQLIERSGVLRNRCDLDLLIFFVHHPYTLLTSDQLATFVGQDVQHVGASLEMFMQAGLLKRSQHPDHSARLYTFSARDHDGGWLPSLVDFASTRDGRLAVLHALEGRSGRQATGPSAQRTPDRVRLFKIG